MGHFVSVFFRSCLQAFPVKRHLSKGKRFFIGLSYLRRFQGLLDSYNRCRNKQLQKFSSKTATYVGIHKQ